MNENDTAIVDELFKDDEGDYVKPKNPKRRQLPISPELKQRIREKTNLEKRKQESDVVEQEEPFEEDVEVETESNADDFLDDVIPFMESVQDGIYLAKIISMKAVKNNNVMISFSVKIDSQFYYSLFAFFPKTSMKGNATYLLLNAFDDKDLSFRSLVKRSVIVSIKVVKKEGRIYENIVDFANEEYEISDLKVDKYGRFIF